MNSTDTVYAIKRNNDTYYHRVVDSWGDKLDSLGFNTRTWKKDITDAHLWHTPKAAVAAMNKMNRNHLGINLTRDNIVKVIVTRAEVGTDEHEYPWNIR